MQIGPSPNQGSSGSPENMVTERKPLDFYSTLCFSAVAIVSDMFALSCISGQTKPTITIILTWSKYHVPTAKAQQLPSFVLARSESHHISPVISDTLTPTPVQTVLGKEAISWVGEY